MRNTNNKEKSLEQKIIETFFEEKMKKFLFEVLLDSIRSDVDDVTIEYVSRDEMENNYKRIYRKYVEEYLIDKEKQILNELIEEYGEEEGMKMYEALKGTKLKRKRGKRKRKSKNEEFNSITEEQQDEILSDKSEEELDYKMSNNSLLDDYNEYIEEE